MDAKSLSSGSERASLAEHHRPVPPHTSGSNKKHNVLTHFSKDPNGEICKRTKFTRVPYRRHTKIDIPLAERLKREIRAIIIGMQSLYKICANQLIQSYPCRKKTSQETLRSSQKFLDQEASPEVIYTDKSLELGKACEHLRWIHCTSTSSVRDAQYRRKGSPESKDGTLLSCYRPGSMNYRGQIPWSVTAICAMLKTSCETGKLHRIGDMENHSVGHLFLSDRRLDIIRYLQKVRRRFSWERRSSPASPRAAPGMPEKSGKETYSLQTLRNYTTLRRQKYTMKDSTNKMFSCRYKETRVHSLVQMVQQSWQVKTTKFGHPTSLGDIPNMEKDTAVHIKEKRTIHSCRTAKSTR